MKKSEMIDAIKGDLARMDLDFMHGRNLDKIPYHARIEMVTTYVLSFAERYGMVPPANEGSIKIEEGEDGQLFIPIWRWEEEEEEKNK